MNEFTKHSIDKYTKGLGGSRSGPGSTMKYTEPIRETLKGFIEDNDIKSIFDAPCGHGNWICDVLSSVDVSYHGIDITPASVEAACDTCEGVNTKFEVADMFEYEFPSVDLFICRDFLFHCSLDLGKKIVEKIKASGSKYVGFTSFPNIEKNNDIPKDYGYRDINMEKSPYYMSDEVARCEEQDGARCFIIYKL